MSTTRKRNEADLGGLLNAVADGDREALAALYQQVEGRVYAFALSRLGNAEAAQDLLHEVLLTVWRRAGSFQGRSRPLTWILGIAHHKIIDALRKSNRWQEEPPDETAVDTGAPNPFEAVADDQRRSAIRGALEKLSDQHRQVIHLAFFEDLPYTEIARILEIPEGTVKTRMFHAKKTLQKRLRPQLGGTVGGTVGGTAS